MKLVVAALGLCLASVSPALPATVADAQPLAVTVAGSSVRATHLPSYDPQIPIAVTVAADQARDLSLVASGPAGRSRLVPLAHAANGSFGGRMSLNEPGTWRLQVAVRDGSVHTRTSPVMLLVAPPPPSNAAPIGWAVGIGIFIIFGGSGFLLLRRRVPAEPPLELEEAA
jgi:hypothetical protein